MISLVNLLKEAEEEMKCPVATQNIDVNLKNRQIAIDRYGYGPLNPNNPNIKFWEEKQLKWKLDTIEETKDSRCGNCAAFNITTKMLNCLEKGILSGEKYVDVDQPESNTDQPEPSNKPVAEGEGGAVAAKPEEPKTDPKQDGSDATWDTIEAGKLGYCTFLKFKCAASRTCDAWVVGGPVKDKK